ncbi:MAG: hypothetical protein RR851_10325 [Clostridium sp.]
MKPKGIENMQGWEQCIAKEAEDKKSPSVTVGSKQIDTHENILDGIIPLGIDIDNNEFYDIKTGETIKDLS